MRSSGEISGWLKTSRTSRFRSDLRCSQTQMEVVDRRTYHGESHAVDLMFVFGLVLSEGAVPGRRQTGDTEDQN